MSKKDWRLRPIAEAFEQDCAAWRKTRPNEATMTWNDAGPFTISAYGLLADLASTYTFLAHKNKLPTALPEECTPSGFYYAAVECRNRQTGVKQDLLDVKPYSELAPFSKFIYERITDRLRAIVEVVDDGLGLDDDGLGDGL